MLYVDGVFDQTELPTVIAPTLEGATLAIPGSLLSHEAICGAASTLFSLLVRLRCWI